MSEPPSNKAPPAEGSPPSDGSKFSNASPSPNDPPSPKDSPPLSETVYAPESNVGEEIKVDNLNNLNVDTSIDSVEIEQYFIPPSEPPPRQLLPVSGHIVILDQGAESASVGFAVAAVINYMRSERGIKERVSPRMLYQMGKQYDEWADDDYEGTSVKGALAGWYQHGVCPDSLWSYQPGEVGDLSKEAMRVALQNKPESILRLQKQKADWQWALNDVHAIIAVANVHQGWSKVTDEGRINNFSNTEPEGLQPFAILGYTEDGFIIQNSWGPEWSQLKLDDQEFPGLALWSYEDFDINGIEAWMASIPGELEDSQSFASNYARSRADYRSDSLEGQKDCFDITHDVESLCMVIASREVHPPLSIGLFGDWGVGKSFFIHEMKSYIKELADDAKEREQNREQKISNREPAFWSDIVQIEFNAWHYMDSNLWASLIVRIFDELARHMAGTEGSITGERIRLFEEIEKEHIELEQLKSEQETIEKSLENEHGRLKKVETDINSEKESLADLDIVRMATKEWNKRIAGSSELKQAVETLGVPEAVQSFSQLRSTVDDLRSTVGMGRVRLAALFQGGNSILRAISIIGILGAGVAISWLIPQLASTEEWLKAVGELGKYITWVSGVVVAINMWLRNVNSQLTQVIKCYDEVGESMVETDVLKRQRVIIETKIKKLETGREGTIDKIERHETKIKELESLIEDLKVGRRLYRFIEEKVESSDYRDKLGIVADIRTDLQVLTDLLAENSEEKRRAWDELDDKGEDEQSGQENMSKGIADIDRIVLYIDDLDRCPPERVVEVLQAVHLLLAFNLFVVVVAVDSRWLLRSLEKEYPEFLALDNKDGINHVITRWASTPQNYLEKIFQVALAIKPITAGGYSKLLDDLIGTPPSKLVDEASISDQTRGALPTKLAQRPANLPISTQFTGEKRVVDPNPPSLEIPRSEFDFMQSLYGFIGTPRAVKRFVNTYRLFRASLWADELRNYTATESDDPKAVLILLAILTGSPQEAIYLFLGLDSEDDDQQWEQFTSELKPRAIVTEGVKGIDAESLNDRMRSEDDSVGERRDILRYENNVCRHIDPTSEPRWIRLQTALSELSGANFETVEPLRKWVRQVARYAFHPFHFDVEIKSDESERVNTPSAK